MFINWARGEPATTATNGCAAMDMSQNGKWVVEPCRPGLFRSIIHNYICEFRKHLDSTFCSGGGGGGGDGSSSSSSSK